MDLSIIPGIETYLEHAPIASAWLTGLLTLGAAALGYKSNKDSQKTQQNAINQQAGIEAQKQAMAQEQLNIADKLLYGDNYNKDTHNVIDPGGAWGKAKSFSNEYLNWLTSSPDLTYNAQRGAMEGQIRDSMSAAASALGKRGLNTANVQSGAALRTVGDIGMARTGILSQMEAGRFDRRGERLGMAAQITQNDMDRALNLRNAATGSVMGFNSQIPQMQMGVAQQQANQAGAWGGLTGTLLDYYTQSRQPSVQIPTTVPVAGGSNIPAQTSQFYSFKQPVKSPYQPRTYWGS